MSQKKVFRGDVGIGTVPNRAVLEVWSSSNDRLFIAEDTASTSTGFEIFGNSGDNSVSIKTSGGSNLEHIRFHEAGDVVINEGGNDADFRVESDSFSHALFVEGSTGAVGINENNPDGHLHITGNNTSDGATIYLQEANNNTNDTLGGIFFGNNVDSSLARIVCYTDTNSTTSTLRFMPTNSGTARKALELRPTEAVFNENGEDYDFRVESDSNTHALFVDAGNNRMEIGVPLRMTDKTAKIAWPDGGGNYTTYIGAVNHPTGGYSTDNHTYWLDLRSAGGTHITLNTDGARTSARNTYDHFTIWQKAPNQTDGRACFSVDNVGNAYFANAGCTFDRGWDGYPSITVNNVSGTGIDNQASYAEFRVHGGGGDEDTWWGGAGDSDFSVNFRIDGGAYYSSDRRKKTNIESLTNAVETVKQLEGVRFQVINNAGTAQEHLSKSGYKMGFIAQDLEDVIPDAVKYYADEDDGTDGYNNSYSVDYGSVVALLTNAIKEQQATIESLEARIAALET